jgi:hypothetical protein
VLIVLAVAAFLGRRWWRRRAAQGRRDTAGGAVEPERRPGKSS